MFQDLDSTLRTLLDDPAAPPLLRNAEVNFETPDKNYRPSQATVNLFLHEVKENRTLRDPQPLRVLQGNDFVRRLPPLRVDCSYLVTAWSNQDGALKVAEEHQLLGQVLAWLARFPTIEERHCQGMLAQQPYEPPTLVAQMDGKQTISDFWSALGIAPRPAFTLVVTITLDLAVEQIEGPTVVTHEIRLKTADRASTEEQSFVIGGVIKQAGSNVLLAGATITLQELGWTTQSGADGRFQLSGVAAGQYLLVVTAPGYAADQRAIQLSDQSTNLYDFQLAKEP